MLPSNQCFQIYVGFYFKEIYAFKQIDFIEKDKFEKRQNNAVAVCDSDMGMYRVSHKKSALQK